MPIYEYPRTYVGPQSKKPNAPYLTADERERAKYIVVMGETGTGKTTFLNSLTNYMMDIQQEDDFRYHLVVEDPSVSQANSQTSEVNIYAVRPKSEHVPPLVIIDTPGYGDTRGIEKDKEIDNMLMDLFTKQVDRIHLICFVAKASSNRLTAVQSYVFNKVLNMFGKDISENFLFVLTFCDGGEPQFVSSLQDKTSLVAPIIPTIKDPWYLQFNNSVVFEKFKSTNKMSSMFWDLFQESMKEFIRKLNGMKEKSLTLSRQVINERKCLNAIIEDLQFQLKKQMTIKTSIEKFIVDLRANEAKIESSKNFMIDFDEPYTIKVNLSPGQFTTLCTVCNKTCHKSCAIGPGESKRGCAAISGDYCKVCPSKCHYDKHHNADFVIDCGFRKSKKKVEDLEAAYVDATSSKSKTEQLLEGLAGEIETILTRCVQIQKQIKESINKLNQIALHPGNFKTTNDYLDLLISNEKNSREKGWETRVEVLEQIKDRNIKIEKLMTTQDYEKKSKNQILEEILKKDDEKKAAAKAKSFWNFW